MIVVDTSVWINYLQRKPTDGVRKLREIRNSDEIIIVGDIILAEVLQGARTEEHAAILEHHLREFALASMLGRTMAVRAARNYRLLRSRGVTLRKWADLIIGTFAIEHGHELLHEDRDYDLIQQHLGLRVY